MMSIGFAQSTLSFVVLNDMQDEQGRLFIIRKYLMMFCKGIISNGQEQPIDNHINDIIIRVLECNGRDGSEEKDNGRNVRPKQSKGIIKFLIPVLYIFAHTIKCIQITQIGHLGEQNGNVGEIDFGYVDGHQA